MFFEEKTLQIPLTAEEKVELKDRNAEIDLELIRDAEKLSEYKTNYKAKTDPLKKEKGRNLITLRSGYIEKTLKVAEVVDEVKGEMQYIDEQGVIIDCRPLTPKERHQYKIPFNKPQIAA